MQVQKCTALAAFFGYCNIYCSSFFIVGIIDSDRNYNFIRYKEKVDAILKRMEATSRMKDFFDIYYLSNMFDFEG
jgi:hypothetical protein